MGGRFEAAWFERSRTSDRRDISVVISAEDAAQAHGLAEKQDIQARLLLKPELGNMGPW
jgi:hypothetical protein